MGRAAGTVFGAGSEAEPRDERPASRVLVGALIAAIVAAVTVMVVMMATYSRPERSHEPAGSSSQPTRPAPSVSAPAALAPSGPDGPLPRFVGSTVRDAIAGLERAGATVQADDFRALRPAPLDWVVCSQTELTSGEYVPTGIVQLAAAPPGETCT